MERGLQLVGQAPKYSEVIDPDDLRERHESLGIRRPINEERFLKGLSVSFEEPRAGLQVEADSPVVASGKLEGVHRHIQRREALLAIQDVVDRRARRRGRET